MNGINKGFQNVYKIARQKVGLNISVFVFTTGK